MTEQVPSKELVDNLKNAARFAFIHAPQHTEKSLFWVAAVEIERLQKALTAAIDSSKSWSYPRTAPEPSDAARYRFLRDKAIRCSDLEAFVACGQADAMPNEARFDAWIDAARAAQPPRDGQ